MAHIRDSSLLCLYGLTYMVMFGTAAAADPTFKLSSGNEIPVIGFGTWLIKPEDIEASVTAALDSGYRHIDTAMVYGNQEGVGKALKAWFDKGNKREDVFISSMLPPFGNREAEVESYTMLSLQKLGLDYFDMYSIHWPTGLYRDKKKGTVARYENGSIVLDYDTDHVAIWKAMEAQMKAGRAKSLGLSNFNETQMTNVYESAEIKPSYLQVEWHIYLQQVQLLDACRKNNIVLASYSTLGSPGQDLVKFTKSYQTLPQQMENPIVLQIAESTGKSAAQVLLRHAIQNDVVVVPKSSKPDRIKENHEIFNFELSAQEMYELNGLDKGEDGRMFDFLNFPGLETHPQYPFSAQLKNAGTY